MPLDNNIFNMVINAGFIVKVVMLILLVFSVISWAVILQKFIIFKRILRESKSFLAFVKDHNDNLSLCYGTAKRYTTPFSDVFSKACKEAVLNKDLYLQTNPLPISYIKDDLKMHIKKVISEEIKIIEKNLPFLATTGNTTPFIGLFGTVWGIMNAFRGIGIKGGANLATVAPGISEALIATAMGLFAAIPAVIAYNHYLNKINSLAGELEDFSEDVIRLVLKEFQKELQKRKEQKVSMK